MTHKSVGGVKLEGGGSAPPGVIGVEVGEGGALLAKSSAERGTALPELVEE